MPKTILEWYKALIVTFVTTYLILFFLIGGQLNFEIHYENVNEAFLIIKKWLNLL